MGKTVVKGQFELCVQRPVECGTSFPTKFERFTRVSVTSRIVFGLTVTWSSRGRLYSYEARGFCVEDLPGVILPSADHQRTELQHSPT